MHSCRALRNLWHACPSAPVGCPSAVSPLPPQLLQLVELFGSTRDEWMAADMEGWLAPNRIYPGVAKAVRALMERDETYIVTTKQVGESGLRGGWRASHPRPWQQLTRSLAFANRGGDHLPR